MIQISGLIGLVFRSFPYASYSTSVQRPGQLGGTRYVCMHLTAQPDLGGLAISSEPIAMNNPKTLFSLDGHQL